MFKETVKDDMINLVTVKTFDSYFLANIILGRLRSEGIECYLKDEATITIPQGGYRKYLHTI